MPVRVNQNLDTEVKTWIIYENKKLGQTLTCT